MQSAKQAVNAPSSSRSRTNRETSRVDLSWVRRKRCGSHASLPEKTAIENVYLMTQIAEGGFAATIHWNAERNISFKNYCKSSNKTSLLEIDDGWFSGKGLLEERSKTVNKVR